MDVTALDFFYNAINIILSRLGDLFDLVERTVTIRDTRQYSQRHFQRWRSNDVRSKKVTESRLDRSIPASKTLALVQRLAEKIDGIFLRLSQQQSEDISLEITRYTKMVDYCFALREFAANQNLEEVLTIRPKIDEILFGFARFTPEQCEAVDQLFQKLKEALKSSRPLTNEEKQMIHLAMSKDFHGELTPITNVVHLFKDTGK